MGTLTDEIRRACISEINAALRRPVAELERLSWTDLYREYFTIRIQRLVEGPTLVEFDIIDNAAQWGWAAFGYAYPGKNITAVDVPFDAILIEWNDAPTQSPTREQMAFVNVINELIPGHTYRARAVVDVPGGSLPVRLSHAFTASGAYTTETDTDVSLELFTSYSNAKGFGIESTPEPGLTGVSVKSLEVVDTTPAIPYTSMSTSTLLRAAWDGDVEDSVSTILRREYAAQDTESLQDAAYRYWRNL